MVAVRWFNEPCFDTNVARLASVAACAHPARESLLYCFYEGMTRR